MCFPVALDGLFTHAASWVCKVAVAQAQMARGQGVCIAGACKRCPGESIVADYTKSAFNVQAEVVGFFRRRPQKLGRAHDLSYISSLLIAMLHKY